ncbi:shikimate dehydrogenase family protein [Paracoccus beibuensis]|uniref:shikimate dehydrogenase family protein n=1 Tax=Paracoccus beibuensis TaxID=547602 RepID=UPI002240533E|nr:hypothetical protein [Paracoccus beibuensis]
MLGDPVVQVKTPTAFQAWASAERRDIVMIPMRVAPSDLPATLTALRGWQNCCGAVVTYPHKQAVAAKLDGATAAVSLVGACNVVRRLPDGRLLGGMTDGIGFVRALSQNGFDPAGRDVQVVGAGGAGSAIALALIEAGAGRLVLSDRNAELAHRITSQLKASFPERRILTARPEDFDCAMACNATPVGMNGDPAHPLRLEDLPEHCFVADIVPEPPLTSWLRAAKDRGHAIQTGPDMVKAQLPAVVEHLDL